MYLTLRWRHNDHAGVSNHQPPGCLLNRLFRRKSKKTSKLRVTGLCVGNSPGTGEFSAQMASYAENVSIWWRHHDYLITWIILVMCSVSESRRCIFFHRLSPYPEWEISASNSCMQSNFVIAPSLGLINAHNTYGLPTHVTRLWGQL